MQRIRLVPSDATDDARRPIARDDETTVYEIGPFRLDRGAGVLTHFGVAEALGPRAVAVLAALVERAREPVTKSELMRAAWSGLVVEDANLSVQISAIRRVLARTAGGERWLETLSRRGYRFIGPVVELRNGLRQPAQRDRVGQLPVALTSFIGRERELVEVKRLLAKSRLLTLTGAGGIGKTRLALQTAAEVSDAYRDGVWFVDFGALDDPKLVPTAAARVLAVRQSADTPLVVALRRRVAGQRLLLILDNCEHVLDAAARLAEALLQGSTEPTILATSREPLRIGGEQVYRLPSLAVPQANADAQSIRQSDSVQLFVDRAQHRRHDFELTQESTHEVARLCARLDGIPFALELAAARVAAYSVDEINARLDDRFDLLTDGSRTALPRQQTLRATLDWSYDLLSEKERAVLRRVALFLGGFTLEAASGVATDATISAAHVRDIVTRLVARSLVVDDASGLLARYRLLETTRAYARAKLDESGETATIHRRHAEYFRSLFDGAASAWLRLADADWRERYLPDVDNLRAALDWSLGLDGDSTIAIALAGSSGSAWTSLSLFGEGIERLEAAAARLAADTSAVDEARLRMWLGALLEPSAPPRAVAALERAGDLYRKANDAEGHACSLVWLAHALTTTGRYAASADALARARPGVDATNAIKLRAMYFANAGFLSTQTNDLHSALASHSTALELYREAGSAVSAAASLGNVADVSWSLRELDAAETAFREAVALHRRSGSRGKHPLGYCLANLAGVLTERGKLSEALDAAREGFPLLGGTGYAWLLIDHLALRAALAGKIENAAKVAGYADAAHASRDATRQTNEARARERLRSVVDDRLDRPALERYLAEGARLSEADACRIALED